MFFCSPDFAAHSLSSIMDEPCEDMSADALEWLNTQHEAELEELAREHEHWNGSSDQGNHSGPFCPKRARAAHWFQVVRPLPAVPARNQKHPPRKGKPLIRLWLLTRRRPNPRGASAVSAHHQNLRRIVKSRANCGSSGKINRMLSFAVCQIQQNGAPSSLCTRITDER
mgnify:CR=1 FL=1